MLFNIAPLIPAPARADNSIEALYQQHYSRIYSILYRLLGNHADAEDVCQQLFLKLYQTQPDQLPVDEIKLVGWLYRVTLNEGYNALRSRKRRTAWQETFDRLWPFSRSATLNSDSACRASTSSLKAARSCSRGRESSRRCRRARSPPRCRRGRRGRRSAHARAAGGSGRAGPGFRSPGHAPPDRSTPAAATPPAASRPTPPL